MKTLVYKLGGSLLSLPGLAARLRTVLRHRAARPLLVVGGGATADIVREWDRIHRLGDERAHWLALRSMTLNEALLAELLPEARLVASRPEAEQAWAEGRWPILCAYEYLMEHDERRQDEPSDKWLPHTWDVTSDSIAAWIALRWPADGLGLLKSAPWPGSPDALRPPLVDEHFRHLLPRLPSVEWINLREQAGQSDRDEQYARGYEAVPEDTTDLEALLPHLPVTREEWQGQHN